jgi:VWFA-related protein
MSPRRRGGKRTLGLPALIVAAGAIAAGPRSDASQNQPAPFRSAADIVSVFATVTDRDGRSVRDLSIADFQVTDNGRRQPIVVFSQGEAPITTVIMLDCSGSMTANADRVRDGAGEFVSRLGSQDRARIGNFARQIRLSPSNFTNDRDVLRRVLQYDLQDMGPSPVWTAVDRSITVLRAEPGRRVILLFSDGHDDPDLGQIVTEFRDVVHRARYNDIMVYAIAFPKITGLSLGQRRGQLFELQQKVEIEKPHSSLKQLAAETGGGYFELQPEDDLGPTFARVADELHQQYWLGFKASSLDGKVHSIGVKVRRSDVTVRARKSYVADAGR